MVTKTKEFNQFLIKNNLSNVLIVSDKDSNKNINRSARNIKNVVLTLSSIKKIENKILNEKN